LSIGGSADDNLFVGVGAGSNNTSGQGKFNTFSGYQAGFSNSSGINNTFSGYQAGYSNTTANGNTFTGYQTGYSNTAIDNTFYGSQAGRNNTTGSGNTFTGWWAGNSNTSGTSNTFTGYAAGQLSLTSNDNTFVGYEAGYKDTAGFNTFIGAGAGLINTSGNNNTYVGYIAGDNNTSGSNDIYIANEGPISGTENNTIRLGGPFQTSVYVAGIYGVNIGSGSAVYINSNGQLGTLTSSRRFKEQIRDMGDSTNALMKLRPVTFLYKPEYSDGPRTLQYGLIAEEVAEVYPDLVAYEPDGKPYTVKYQYLATMLLNEMQKQYHRAEAQAEVIKTQQQEIDGLKAQLQLQNAAFQERLSRLEGMVGARAAANPAQASIERGARTQQ
jgi:hypothetical protein